MDYKIENALFFLIGVSEYQSSDVETKLTGRPFVKAGLNALVEALKSATDNKEGKNIISILNPNDGMEITERIRYELDEKQRSETKVEFIFFYYCGHGMLHDGKIHYMTTVTCTTGNYTDPGKHVNLAIVFQIFSEYEVAKSATIFTLIDSCYSGAIPEISAYNRNLYILASCEWNKKSTKGEEFSLVSEKIINILEGGIDESKEGCLTIDLVAKQLDKVIGTQKIHKIDVGAVGVGDFKFAKNRRAKNVSYEGYKPIDRSKQKDLFHILYGSKAKTPKTTFIVGPREELANELIDRFIHYYFSDKICFDNRKTFHNQDVDALSRLSYRCEIDYDTFRLCPRELAYSFGVDHLDGEITADTLISSKPSNVILCTLTINLNKAGLLKYRKLKKFIHWYCDQFWHTSIELSNRKSIYLFVNIITPYHIEESIQGQLWKYAIKWSLNEAVVNNSKAILYLQKVLREDIEDFLWGLGLGTIPSGVLKNIRNYDEKMTMLEAQEKTNDLIKAIKASTL